MNRSPPVEPASRAAELVAFYRATVYGVELPDGSVANIRVGAPAPATLCAWIGTAPCAWYVTACNPFSEPLPERANAKRMAALRDELDHARCRFLPGVAAIPGAAWREPSFLVAGIAESAVDDLLDRFGQNAAVRVPADGPALLRVQRLDWRGRVDPAADLEWRVGDVQPA